MKLNIFQKIILFLYGCLFVYFSTIHVPFETSRHNEIKYDTLFSNSSNLEFSRLVLIIVILTILTAVLFLLLRNVNYSYKAKSLSKKRIKIFNSFIGIVLLIVAIFSINKFQTKKEKLKIISEEPFQSVDSTVIAVDTANSIEIPPFVKKNITCTEEHALEDFKSYMKFYYPDWKIYGKPVVKEQSDCTYRIQFTTLDPHIKYEREVIIVEISYNYDYSRYTCRTIRGTLY